MPHTLLHPTGLPTGALDGPPPSHEQPVPGYVRSTDAMRPVFDREVEGDRLGEETLAYKEILVVLVLILFVLLRSLLV